MQLKKRVDPPLHLHLTCIPADCVTSDKCSLITTANTSKPRSGFQAAVFEQDDSQLAFGIKLGEYEKRDADLE